MRLKESAKTVIVTGAGSGIGYAIVTRFLDLGYNVAAWDINLGKLATVRHERMWSKVVDVSDRTAVLRAAGDVIDRNNRIDALVACAAVFNARPFLALDDNVWDATFAVNLKGTLFACQAVLPAMRTQRGGSIVLFSSTLARSGAVNGAHYAATKGGILGLARSIALEVAEDGIRVNVVSPGLTDTPQPRGNMSEAQILARAREIPLGRMGTADDMVEATIFLIGEDSSFVTAQDIRVNGGFGLF